MRISALIQKTAIDLQAWDPDADHATFPQGARTKSAFLAPANPKEPCVAPGKRYLFKESKKQYPDQFWMEVIAYRIGCLLGLAVPPAFAAVLDGTCGALIEWFYQDGKEAFIHAGDPLISFIRPEFDRKQGNFHNLHDNQHLLRLLTKRGLLKEDWQQWWVDALVFDTLIGNTDRHQDNWGFILSPPNPAHSYRLPPYFDNGTSLGHERFPERIRGWKEAEFAHYLAKGTHHVRRLPVPTTQRHRHIDLLAITVKDWPSTEAIAAARIARLEPIDFREVLSDLSSLDLPVPLSRERLDLVLRLLDLRLESLKALFS